jgi:hypothetical protein
MDGMSNVIYTSFYEYTTWLDDQRTYAANRAAEADAAKSGSVLRQLTSKQVGSAVTKPLDGAELVKVTLGDGGIYVVFRMQAKLTRPDKTAVLASAEKLLGDGTTASYYGSRGGEHTVCLYPSAPIKLT